MGSSRGRSPHGSPRGLQFRALRVSGRAPQLPVPCVPPSGAADATRPLSSIPFAVTFPTAPLSSLLLPPPPVCLSFQLCSPSTRHWLWCQTAR